MTDLVKPEVILTHESDLDGLIAGVLLQRLARRLFDANVPLEAYHYNFWKQRELRERAAWVAYAARLTSTAAGCAGSAITTGAGRRAVRASVSSERANMRT